MKCVASYRTASNVLAVIFVLMLNVQTQHESFIPHNYIHYADGLYTNAPHISQDLQCDSHCCSKQNQVKKSNFKNYTSNMHVYILS